MANITEKPDIGGTPADGDKLYIVDVSDTTDNANGSDKHVLVSDLKNIVPDADSTTKGKVELATTAETTTGADATRAVTPDGLKDGYQGSANVTTVGTVTTGTWQGTAVDGAYVDIEGTEIKSTGEVGGTKYLREDGDGTCSWQSITGGGDMLASNNLSDVANVATARTNLGLAIGSDVQAHDAQLDSLAGLTPGVEGNMITADGLGGYQTSTVASVRSYLNVEDGATADQTGAEIKTAYEGEADTNAFTDADHSKLDGIEASADVTDATNVTTALGSISIDAHSGVDTDKSKTPADGDVLTFDGTDWNAETPAGGGGSEIRIANSTDFINVSTATRFSRSLSGSGAIEDVDNGVRVRTNSTASSKARVSANGLGIGAAIAVDENDVDPIVWWNIQYISTGSGNGNIKWSHGETNDANADNWHNFGFRLDISSGTGTMYAYNKGVALTETDVTSSLPGIGNYSYILWAHYTSGTDIKFYCNETLLATHTTNLPTNTRNYLAIIAENPSSAQDCYTLVGSMGISVKLA